MKILMLSALLLLMRGVAGAGIYVATPVPVIVSQEGLWAKGISIQKTVTRDGVLAVYGIDVAIHTQPGDRYEVCELIVLKEALRAESLRSMDDGRKSGAVRIVRTTLLDASFAFSMPETEHAYVAIQIRFASEGKEACHRYLLPVNAIKESGEPAAASPRP